MESLKITIQQLLSKTNQADKLTEKVSNASVGWHIDHSLMVLNKVLSQLENSDEKDYQSSFNKNRFIVFLLNRIPVGKGKAPEAVKPTEIFDQEKTARFGEKALEKNEASANWHKNKNFNHPIFGMLNKKQTLKFLNIHTNHHLKIIIKIINS